MCLVSHVGLQHLLITFFTLEYLWGVHLDQDRVEILSCIKIYIYIYIYIPTFFCFIFPIFIGFPRCPEIINNVNRTEPKFLFWGLNHVLINYIWLYNFEEKLIFFINFNIHKLPTLQLICKKKKKSLLFYYIYFFLLLPLHSITFFFF